MTNAQADRRDAALQAAFPIVPVPRYGALPELASGARRYLAAADGLYLEARGAIDVCARVAATALPYGPIGDRPPVALPYGPIPAAVVDEAVARAREASPHETALLVLAGADRYELVVPTITEATRGSVRYEEQGIDATRVVLDIHSHGRLPAYFSSTDDASDLSRIGPHVSLVFGRCEGDELEAAVRICCGHHLLDWSYSEFSEACTNAPR